MNEFGKSDWLLSNVPFKAKNPFEEPESPKNIAFDGITSTAMTVSWDAPRYDGGSLITGYILEKRSRNKKWRKVSRESIGGTQYRVHGLQEGQEYVFRVCAVNAAGCSEYSEASNPITASLPLGKTIATKCCLDK